MKSSSLQNKKPDRHCVISGFNGVKAPKNWLKRLPPNQFVKALYHEFLIERQSNQLIPQSGITTAVRNLCSSGARSKKAMLLDLVKDRPPVRQPLDGAGNGDSKGHLVSSGIPVRRKGGGIP